MDRCRFLSTLAIVVSALPAAAEPWYRARLDSVLQVVDAYRGLPGDHRSDLEIEASDGGKTTRNAYRIRVHPTATGRDVLLRSIAPESERGNLVLSTGPDLWILARRTSRPVPVSAQQRLLGDASIGDVLNVDLRGRYEGSGTDTLGGLVLDLSALRPGESYDRIRLEIEPRTGRPLEARFLSRSGRLLKTLRYLSFVRSGGRELAAELEIRDAVDTARTTRVRFSRYAAGKFPPGTFDKGNLRELQLDD